MSGRMRGSSFSKPMRTRTVAFCRSAVGTRRDHVRRNPPIGIGVEHRLDRLIRLDPVDVALADVDFDFERRHVDDGADAGAGEAAAGRHRRDHLARLRVFRDGHAVERRADHRVARSTSSAATWRLVRPRPAACASAMRAFSDSTVDCAVSTSARPTTFSFTSCVRRLNCRSASRSRASSSAAALRAAFNCAWATASAARNCEVVQPGQHLTLLDGLAFFDEYLEHLARHLRRHGRAPPGRDVAGRVQHRAWRRARSGGRRHDRGLHRRGLRALGPEPRRRPRPRAAGPRQAAIQPPASRPAGACALVDFERSEFVF